MLTGGAGYIGSHAVLAFREAGYSVIVIDNLSTGQRSAIPADVPIVVGSVANRALVASVLDTYKISGVIHFAGSVIVSESVSSPLRYYENNTAAARSLIETCVLGNVPWFIFSSTAAVYGAPTDIPIREDGETKPINPYGWSKLMTEQILRDVARAHGMRVGILRYFNVAGADPSCRAGQTGKDPTHLIKLASQVALGLREHLQIFGQDYPTPDGTCIRDYIHVTDLADAHLRLCEYLASDGDSITLNCGYGTGDSVREVIQSVERVMGRSLTVIDGPKRLGDPAELIADASLIRKKLDWRPRFNNLDIIVQTAIEWERSLKRRRENSLFPA